MSSLGVTLRLLRIERNMSQGQLAKAADVARSYVSMIESGERTNVGSETLHRLANALDISPGEILRLPGDVDRNPRHELSPEARRLAERIDMLPPGAYERAIAMVDSVVKGLHEVAARHSFEDEAASKRKETTTIA